MRNQEISGFHWTTGVFCFTAGAFMLIVPRHIPVSEISLKNVQIWGAALLAAGAALLLLETLIIFPRRLVMRNRVIARTREREEAQLALKQANEALESVIEARTAQLQNANAQLQMELHERQKADEALCESEADLKRMVRQVQALNETLEQRVTERTNEAEQRAVQLRGMAAELTMAEQRERRRIAQVLHDHLQQLLVAARMSLGRLNKMTAHLAQAQEVIKHANELIDQSLDISRGLTMEISPPVLYDAGLAKALEWLAAEFQEKHDLVVEADLDPDMTPEGEEVAVFLFQSVRELLFNIVKHAQVATAHLSLQPGLEGMLEICIEDQGQGFDPAMLEQVQDNEHFGLFSVRERLAFFGGEMLIDSAPGQGTRVVLVAPLQTAPAGPLHPMLENKDALPAESGAPPAVAGDAALHDSAGIRVLLVDDHRIFRQGLAGLLREVPSMRVVGEAADGEAAVELAGQLQPQVVIMDITMPRMSGIDAARMISRRWPAIRVIGLSMYKEESIARAMRDAGAVDYLPKDCPSEQLIEAIRLAAEGTGERCVFADELR